jgi:hypothetical protein
MIPKGGGGYPIFSDSESREEAMKRFKGLPRKKYLQPKSIGTNGG